MAKLKRSAPAGDVVLAYLAEQVTALREHEAAVRGGAPDAVHQMRVATRRLRSALRTFRPLLERERTEPVRRELHWLATALGRARDAEVLRDRLLTALDGQSVDGDASGDGPQASDGDVLAEAAPFDGDAAEGSPVDGASVGGEPLAVTRRRVEAALGEECGVAREAAVEALDTDRYRRLLAALDDLLADPPLTAAARRRASKVLPGRVRKAWKDVRAARRAALGAAPEDADAALHELRKAAKRARYAGEALEPAFGKDAARFAAAMEEVQDVLGEHQDSVVARRRILALTEEAWDAGEATVHLGRLITLEESRRRAARAALVDAWRRASGKKLRRWMR